jgi:mRNA interferase MazF
MTSLQWHVFLVNLDPVVGSEQGKTRPVLIISEEQINQILPVVNVLPITSRKPGRKIYPNEVAIPKGMGGLSQESIVLCYQIRTLDKKRLIKVLGKIDSPKIEESIIEAPLFQLGMTRKVVFAFNERRSPRHAITTHQPQVSRKFLEFQMGGGDRAAQ